MHLENLYLANFKNYEFARIEFSNYVNAFLGDNGSGKTNLLDAIHFLSMTKSAFNSTDQNCIRHEQEYFSILGSFSKQAKVHEVNYSLFLGKRKKIELDKKPVSKSSEIIGLFPVVIIAPNDHSIIMEGSEVRRKYVDSILAQVDRSYLMDLIDYNKALKQRNVLLKQFAELGSVDQDLLEPYDQLLLQIGKKINGSRSQFGEELLKSIKRHYRFISEGKEEINLRYISTFSNQDYHDFFKDSFQKDLLLQRTTVGIHRDDYEFQMDNHAIKKFGSQGQQKSFLISLKLAQFDILESEKGFKPIILLDDIFDKLDDHRIQKLTEMIEHHDFGQVFLTDARPERSIKFLEKLNIEWKAIEIKKWYLKPHKRN